MARPIRKPEVFYQRPSIVDHGLPKAEESQKAVLSTFIHSPELLDAKSFPKGFWYPENCPEEKIFEVLKIFRKKGWPIESHSVCQYFMDRPELLNGIGGAGELLNHFVNPYNDYKSIFPGYHTNLMWDAYRMRKVITICDEIKERVQIVSDDWKSDVLPMANDLLNQLTEKDRKRKTVKEIAQEVGDNWQDCLDGKKHSASQTRWKCWNDSLSGLKRPCYTLILGRRKRGKSSLAQNFITHSVMKDEPERGAYFSYEMPVSELMQRAVCDYGNIESKYVFEPDIHRPDIETIKKIARTLNKLSDADMHLYYEPSWTIDQVIAEMHRVKPVVAVLDYLQLVPAAIGGEENRVLDVERTSRLCSQVRGELNLSLIVLSQRNDNGEAAWGKAAENDATLCVSIENDGIFVRSRRDGGADFPLSIQFDGCHYRFVDTEMP